MTQVFRGSRYFVLMERIAKDWPGWLGGYYEWHMRQPGTKNWWAFYDEFEELRHATMLEF